jgi:hypothetical protein
LIAVIEVHLSKKGGFSIGAADVDRVPPDAGITEKSEATDPGI